MVVYIMEMSAPNEWANQGSVAYGSLYTAERNGNSGISYWLRTTYASDTIVNQNSANNVNPRTCVRRCRQARLSAAS